MLTWLPLATSAVSPSFAQGLEAPAAPLGPNSLLGVSVGSPAFVSVRGETWFSAGGTVELGGGVPLATVQAWLNGNSAEESAMFDLALRWRPRSLCFGCGDRALLTLGFGIGGTVEPTPDFVGAWTYAAGPDVAVSGVVWASPTLGFHLTGRVGGGPSWVGTDLEELEPALWAFGTLGIAF